MSGTRLNKYIASSGLCSRRKADELIENGQVMVNGKKVTELGYLVQEKDKVFVDKKLIHPVRHEYYRFYKPAGYITTADDEKGRKTIYDLVDSDVRLFSVGRLDYDTEGLIFLTNDGEFANLITHPKFHFEKEYHVTVEGEIKEGDLAVLRKGVVENGKRMPEARVKLLGYDGKFSKVSVVIDEGQNHQVRRMFDAIGHQIKLLKRVRIGQVRLGGLYRGKTKDMTEEEIAYFKGAK